MRVVPVSGRKHGDCDAPYRLAGENGRSPGLPYLPSATLLPCHRASDQQHVTQKCFREVMATLAQGQPSQRQVWWSDFSFQLMAC